MFCSVGNAGAPLTDKGNGAIWDDVTDQYWYQDVREWNKDEYMSTRQTINVTLNGSACSYQSGSWKDWRMEDITDMKN